LYSSPDIIRQIKSRRMRWVGHVACMREGGKCIQGFGGKAQRKKTTCKRKAKMGSKWTLGRLVGEVWNGFTWTRVVIDGGLL
jgi:hypothetical protein